MVALFELDAVRVELGGRTVLDVEHLAIADGGITVLVGPSGSGKSTLLRLCNRLEVPTSCVVRFRWDDIATLDPLAHRRRVGMVFQRPAPFPGSVRDNLAVALGHVDDRRFASALERAGLDAGFLDRRADDLSGGEAQRMCLARTLVAEPEVLLLDEPTSALDERTARLLEDQARRVAGAGMPLVWVTHDLDQARRLTGTIVVIVAGRIAEHAERRSFLAAGGATDPSGSSPATTGGPASEDTPGQEVGR